ncbi:hypothetical protein [Cognatilysobacter lacus]|uniref:Uncharacterized protein n=1 Tax=Cognatilysobacter lacus TaxID=1643323 RepID=A0A5D8Z7I3_9GAMM|nr:hypothetical protein [Lysobacter lacus]TZF90092.1 hypothetical protein FW784_06690 [Lysobacter lacus]
MPVNPSKSIWLLLAGILNIVVAVLAQTVAPGLASEFARGLLFGVGAALVLCGVMARHLPNAADASTPALRRRYMREYIPAMAGYVVAVLGSTWLLKQNVEDPSLRALVALAPVPFVALAMRAMVRHIRDTDEMQRRIEVESVSLATALASLGYFAAGLLQAAKVIDIPSSVAMIGVFPLICLVYGVAKVVIVRRYA